MRIGMMLRTMDEKGGIGMYSRYLVEELLVIDHKNQYVLFYRSPEHLGKFSHYTNVKEVVLKAYNKALWDQLSIPLAARREKLDLIFHPKFTVPFFTSCKTMMVLHGADWFIPEQAQYYKPLDVRYIKTVMPWYCKKADSIISVSQLTTDNFNKILRLPPGKVTTIYFGPAKFFRQVKDPDILQKVREKYRLPAKFIFSLSKYGIGGGNRKNIDKIFLAYQIYHQKSANPLPLVIGGKNCHKYQSEYNLSPDDYGRNILFPGFLEQEDLPAIYSQAELYLYPSNVEAFPIPLTEAMACGTPIITSNVNGLEEIAGDAALLVDPTKVNVIAKALNQVLTNDDLKVTLSTKGLERSKKFTWEKCAKKTLEMLEHVASQSHEA
jgi:glycosyltransferase involved in cell wall biosynthesis